MRLLALLLYVHHLLPLLRLSLLDKVEQLVLVLLHELLLRRQHLNKLFLSLQLLPIVLVDEVYLLVFLVLQHLQRRLSFIIGVKQLVLEILDLGLLFLVQLRKAHELEVAVDLVEWCLLVRVLLALLVGEAESDPLQVVLDALLEDCNLGALFFVAGCLVQ